MEDDNEEEEANEEEAGTRVHAIDNRHAVAHGVDGGAATSVATDTRVDATDPAEATMAWSGIVRWFSVGRR